MTNKEYFEDRTRITNSWLGWALAGPSYLHKMLVRKEEEAEEDYYNFGSAVHMKILEPDEFYKTYYVPKYNAPSNIIQKKFVQFLIDTNDKINDSTLKAAYGLSYSTKSIKGDALLKKAKEIYDQYKEYIEESISNSHKEILSRSDYDRIVKIDHNIRRHARASELLYSGGDADVTKYKAFNELIIEFDNSKGDKFKSKVDRFIVDEENNEITIVELKTHSVKRENVNMSKSFIESFFKFDYDRQLYFYTLAVAYYVKNTLGMDINEMKFKHKVVVAKSNFDNEVRVFNVNKNVINDGSVKFAEALDAFFHYQTFGYEYPYNVNNLLEEEIK